MIPDLSRYGKIPEQLWKQALDLGMPSGSPLLLVYVSSQRMYLLKGNKVTRQFVVSTSRFGEGNSIDSYNTPTGWHEVVECFGHREPVGRVFRSRKPTSQVISDENLRGRDTGDLILTRILRLGGLEDGKNRNGCCDTYKRCIYIHGTNHENLLGFPSSHGCIRMDNKDILDLFDILSDQHAWCWIGSEHENDTIAGM